LKLKKAYTLADKFEQISSLNHTIPSFPLRSAKAIPFRELPEVTRDYRFSLKNRGGFIIKLFFKLHMLHVAKLLCATLPFTPSTNLQ
jgi:hypothetical protein